MIVRVVAAVSRVACMMITMAMAGVTFLGRMRTIAMVLAMM